MKWVTVGIILVFLGSGVNPGVAENIEKTCSILKGSWLYVGGSGQGNYSRIQDAIDNASGGDTVFVYAYSSPYYQHLCIDKSIRVIGQNQSATIIDGRNISTVITIISEAVFVENFTIRNSGGCQRDSGIITQGNDTSVLNCTIYRARTGVACQGANCIIKGCFIHTTGEGICCTSTHNIVVSATQLCHNAVGVRVNDSTTCRIENTFFHTNGFGCYFEQSSDIVINHCALDDNNDNQGGAYLSSCTTVFFNNSNLCHNGVGINIGDSYDITICHCDLNFNTKRASVIRGNSGNISLLDNEIYSNYHYGVYTNVPLTIHHNNFYDNKLHALYSATCCDATFNWWNSYFGPQLSVLGSGERISRTAIRRFPWLCSPSPSAGSTWETTTFFTPLDTPMNSFHFNLSGNDSDFDGAPDWWEVKYGYDPNHWDPHSTLDEDNDGLTSLEECYTDMWGSNPFTRDIFLEIDWMETNYTGTTNKPDYALIKVTIDVFLEHNISLHIDTGSMGGGELLPYHSKPSFIDFRDLYWTYFLHENLDQPRKGIFHYAIICDDGDAGYAIFGWDQLDFFTIGAQQIKNNYPLYDKKNIIIRGTLHELGHGLGLFGDTFGGIDNHESIKFSSWDTWRYLPYRSCMNYHYTYLIVGYSDGTRGPLDFNDWAHLNLSLFKNTNFSFSC